MRPGAKGSPFEYEQHPDEDVRLAILRLCDALCSWERATSRTSLLVVRETGDGGGFVFRASSGKPVSADNHDVPDEMLVLNDASETIDKCPVAGRRAGF